MVFRRAVQAELANTAGAAFTVLFSIVFSVSLVRILGEAAGGRADNGAVFSIVALSALTSLPTLLTLTVFIAVLATLTRAHRDSEMVIWFSSGMSLVAWIRPVVRFAAPILALVAVLSLIVAPWANRQIAESRERFARRDDVTKIAPGRFVESGRSERVIFVEGVDLEGGKVRNIFVSQRGGAVSPSGQPLAAAEGAPPPRDQVMVAARGVIETRSDGSRYLVLLDGRRYEGEPGRPEYRMLEFERYAIRLDAPAPEPFQDRTTRSRSTADLLRDPNRFNRAELLSRIAAPISALMLALLAIPLAHVNPRVGRSANLIGAVLLFLLYQNGLEIVQTWVSRERMSFWTGTWVVHAIVAALVALLFVRRVRMLRWLPWAGRAPVAAAHAEPAAPAAGG